MSYWKEVIAPFRIADDRRAWLEVVLTVVPFLATWTLGIWLVWSWSLWALAVVPFAGGLLMRMFVVQHDCGHGAMFTTARQNDAVGRLMSVATMVPYDYWRRSHALHHAGNGNLGKRGMGDVWTMTLAEYEAAPRRTRLSYRLYRSPIVLLGLGPAWMFLLFHRWPVGIPRSWSREWKGIYALDAVLALILFNAFLLGVAFPLWLFHTMCTVTAATAGVWLFYVQHQFEGTYYAAPDGWDYAEAALRGSSHYDLPAPLRWLTGNIGYHHVHHLSSTIPFYRLRQAHEAVLPVAETPRLTLWGSLRSLRLRLWDEASGQMIGWRERRRQGREGQAA